MMLAVVAALLALFGSLFRSCRALHLITSAWRHGWGLSQRVVLLMVRVFGNHR